MFCDGTMRRQVKSKKAKGKSEKRRILFFTFIFLLFTCAPREGEIEEMRKDLDLIQARIAEEEARYQAAKAAMERAQIVAQYLFPELRQREKQLNEKLSVLIAEQSKATAKTDKK